MLCQYCAVPPELQPRPEPGGFINSIPFVWCPRIQVGKTHGGLGKDLKSHRPPACARALVCDVPKLRVLEKRKGRISDRGNEDKMTPRSNTAATEKSEDGRLATLQPR